MRKEPTEKQLNRVSRIVEHLGEERVTECLQRHFPTTSIQNMTRKQAQKIITGLSIFLPHKPIYGVYQDPSYWQQ